MAHVEIKAAAPFDDTHTNTSRQKTNANLVHIRESATGNFGILLFFFEGGGNTFRRRNRTIYGTPRAPTRRRRKRTANEIYQEPTETERKSKERKMFRLLFFFLEKKRDETTTDESGYLVSRATTHWPGRTTTPRRALSKQENQIFDNRFNDRSLFSFSVFFLRAVYFVFFSFIHLFFGLTFLSAFFRIFTSDSTVFPPFGFTRPFFIS